MEHKCPTCDRAFKSVSDYPFVYVAKVVRVPIPLEASFLIRDPAVYVGPKSESQSNRPPSEVLEYFKQHLKAESFEHEGWNWEFRTLEACHSLLSKFKQVARAYLHDLEDWEVGSYYRHQDGQFSINTIRKKVEPYLARLESLVGKVVPSSDVLPKFKDSPYCLNRIPETHYDLDLLELDEFHEKMLQQLKLSIPNLETSQSTRKVTLTITESGGGSISIVHSLAVIGSLAYEGRLNS